MTPTTTQAVARKDGVPGVDRLWDSQWVDIVNHDGAYGAWDMTDAIAHAVKLTEKHMAANHATTLSALQAECDALRGRLEAVASLAERWYVKEPEDGSNSQYMKAKTFKDCAYELHMALNAAQTGETK